MVKDEWLVGCWLFPSKNSSTRKHIQRFNSIQIQEANSDLRQQNALYSGAMEAHNLQETQLRTK
jgi:hypothetical protein